MYAIRSYYDVVPPDFVSVTVQGRVYIREDVPLANAADVIDGPEQGLIAFFRITSYNVCYTKLLRIRNMATARALPTGGMRSDGCLAAINEPTRAKQPLLWLGCGYSFQQCRPGWVRAGQA